MQYQPMPLSRKAEPFNHPGWLLEIKWDGFRCISVKLLSVIALVMLQLACFEDVVHSKSTKQKVASGTWQVASTTTPSTTSFFAIKHSNNEWYVSDRIQGFFKSLDNMKTWQPINGNLPAGTGGWTIQVDQNTSTLVIGTLDVGGGSSFYYSNDDGNSYAQIKPTGNFHITAVGAHSGCIMPANLGDNLSCGGYFGSANTSQFYSSNMGQTAAVGGYTPAVASVLGQARNPNDGSYWTGTENNGIFRSADQGKTAVNVFPWQQGPPTNGDTYFLTFDNSGNPVISSLGGVWRGVGSGNTYSWTNTFTNTAQGRGIYTDSSGTIYYGHRANGLLHSLYCSQDSGQTFQPCDAGIPNNLEVYHMEENPNDGNMYVLAENGQTNAATIYYLNVSQRWVGRENFFERERSPDPNWHYWNVGASASDQLVEAPPRGRR